MDPIGRGRGRRRATVALLALAAGAGTLPARALDVLQPAPDFTLRSLDGPNVRLREQRGQVLLINFWASWCGPCRDELPRLDALDRKYGAAGFRVLGINIDDDPQRAQGSAQGLALHFPLLLDTDKAVSRRYSLGTMPSTLIIDRDGRVRYIHLGYRDGYERTYERHVLELLKE